MFLFLSQVVRLFIDQIVAALITVFLEAVQRSRPGDPP